MGRKFIVTLDIEALTARDVHEAIDAAHKLLEARGGCVKPSQVTEAAPLKRWCVLYTRIPTNYNSQQRLIVMAATADDARELVRDRIGDRGKTLSTYDIERVTEQSELAVHGQIVEG
jgi:hypothetical protein